MLLTRRPLECTPDPNVSKPKNEDKNAGATKIQPTPLKWATSKNTKKPGPPKDVVIENEEDPERVAWGSQLEFILTCVGFAVGLGNVWRFPYLTYENGGGAFLIPYLLMLFFVGLPLFFMECSFGQFSSLGPITAYAYSPAFKGVGIAGIVVAAYIALYYNVIVAWCMYYFFASMNDELPWASCGNWWNSEFCIEPDQNITLFPENATLKTSAEEYYYDYVLRITEGIEEMGALRWQLVLCLLMAWVIIFLVLLKGIESLGKASYFVSLFPYVLLTIMLIQGCLLPGAAKGIEYYLKPQWEKLLEAKVWADAATQIFYSLGISMGGLIAMASFNKFSNNIMRDALIIPFVNCGTSIYAGFVIFSVLGYMAERKGVEVSEVAAEGPGLVFVVYPEGLSTMPAAPVWSVLFFFMMTTLGFSSQFSTAEGVVAAFIDEFPALGKGMGPTLCRLALCSSFFLLGLPMVTEGGFYLFNIMDVYSAGYTLLIVAFMELMALIYVYGYKNYAEDIAMMLGHKPGYFWQATWRVVSPGAIFVVFISKCAQQTPLTFEDYVYPQWANGIGWCIVAFPCVVMIAVFCFTYCTRGGYTVLKEITSPTPRWGPARAKDRTGRYALPKDEHLYEEPELPHYWHAVKLWNGIPGEGPPSYGNGSANGGSRNGVKSVSENIPMSKYEPIKSKQEDVNAYTYMVAQPLSDDVKPPKAETPPRSDFKRHSTASSAASEKSNSSKSNSTTVAEVYAVPQKRAAAAAGKVNEAFDMQDESPGSSPDSSPVARPKSVRELKTEL